MVLSAGLQYVLEVFPDHTHFFHIHPLFSLRFSKRVGKRFSVGVGSYHANART